MSTPLSAAQKPLTGPQGPVPEPHGWRIDITGHSRGQVRPIDQIAVTGHRNIENRKHRNRDHLSHELAMHSTRNGDRTPTTEDLDGRAPGPIRQFRDRNRRYNCDDARRLHLIWTDPSASIVRQHGSSRPHPPSQPRRQRSSCRRIRYVGDQKQRRICRYRLRDSIPNIPWHNSSRHTIPHHKRGPICLMTYSLLASGIIARQQRATPTAVHEGDIRWRLYLKPTGIPVPPQRIVMAQLANTATNCARRRPLAHCPDRKIIGRSGGRWNHANSKNNLPHRHWIQADTLPAWHVANSSVQHGETGMRFRQCGECPPDLPSQ